jgi:hypothetical protein
VCGSAHRGSDTATKAHEILRSKLKNQNEFTRTVEVSGMNVHEVEEPENVGRLSGDGERSEIDGTMSAATVAENKPH